MVASQLGFLQKKKTLIHPEWPTHPQIVKQRRLKAIQRPRLVFLHPPEWAKSDKTRQEGWGESKRNAVHPYPPNEAEKTLEPKAETYCVESRTGKGEKKTSHKLRNGDKTRKNQHQKPEPRWEYEYE
jgi:hypothetical protein